MDAIISPSYAISRCCLFLLLYPSLSVLPLLAINDTTMTTMLCDDDVIQ